MNRSLFDKDWFYLVAKFKWSMLAWTPSSGDGVFFFGLVPENHMLKICKYEKKGMLLYVALFCVFVCRVVSRFAK